MILYEAVSTYHLLCALAEQMNNKQNRSVLLMASSLREKYSDLDLIYECFERIIFYDLNYAIKVALNKKAIGNYFCGLIGIEDLSELPYEKIYCSCGHHSFGYFLELFNIKHIFCEDAAGLLSRPNILIDINDKIVARSDFNKECIRLGMYDGNSENVILHRCNLKAQKSNFSDKVEHFDIIEKLYLLKEDERSKIINFFIQDNISIEIPKNITLILAQHFNNLGTHTFEEQIVLYQLFVDYFFKDKAIVIKSHPSDVMYYSELFKDARVINDNFPSEIIPFVFQTQPHCVATISSTAIFNLRGHYPKIFELDSRYEKDFHYTHKYYASVCIAKALNRGISYIAANEILLQKLADSIGMTNVTFESFSETSGKGNVLVMDDIIDEGEVGREKVLSILKYLGDDTCVIFINSKNDYCWYDYHHRELWNDIIPVVLTKDVHKPQSEDFYVSTDDEVIYVYSKNKELLNMVRNLEIEKELPHTGITICKTTLSSEQERIKMLEGILEATEKRLLYYIEKEKENA